MRDEAQAVLLVEDDTNDAELFKRLLVNAGIDLSAIVHRTTLSDGLKACSEHSFDVVLLDLSLPDADGVESIDNFIAQEPDLPVVVLTGDTDRSKATDALKIGAEDYLYKGETSQAELLLRSLSYAIERKRSRKAVKELDAHILKAQRLESLEVLAGGVAHDFNNLLVGVMGNASMALAELPPGSDIRPMINDIERAALAAAELTRQMLAYAGKGRFLVKIQDLSSLVADTAELLRTTISRNASIRFDNSAVTLPVKMDATQIQQILMNLVSNASESLEGGQGSIFISVGRMQVDQGDIDQLEYGQQLQLGEHAFIEVTDSGIGMDKRTKTRLFDPFYTTKFTGRGLGLAACLGIARGHEGAFRVYSEPKQGTSIKLLLPLAVGSSLSTPESELEHQPSRSTRVLIVDDNASVRAVASRVLGRAGFDVLMAEDGMEAVNVFSTHRQEIHLVLLDMTMPRLDGEETCRQLRVMKPDLPVLMMSGYNEQEVTRRFAGRGLAGFIQKPFQPQALLTKIDEVLN